MEKEKEKEKTGTRPKNPTYLSMLKEKTPQFRTGRYLYGAECICPVCKKHFWSGDDWAFVLFRTRGDDKTGDIRTCSYTCLKKGQEAFEAHTREVFSRRARMYFHNDRTGERLNVSALSRRLGMSCALVRKAYHNDRALSDWKPEKKQSDPPQENRTANR